MTEYYKIALPTQCKHINTMIDAGITTVVSPMFDSGITHGTMYTILGCSDFSESDLHVMSNDIEELLHVRDSQGLFATMQEAATSEQVISLLTEYRELSLDRYKLFKEKGVRYLKQYNLNVEPSDQMKPVVVCWVGMDTMLKYMNTKKAEKVIDLLTSIQQLARITGVSIMLHSDKPGEIKQLLGDVSVLYTDVHIDTCQGRFPNISVRTCAGEYSSHFSPNQWY